MNEVRALLEANNEVELLVKLTQSFARKEIENEVFTLQKAK
jgi:hypothetical protein